MGNKIKMYLDLPDPCSENWENMLPGMNGRFCQRCRKEVIDFTTMSDSEILKFFVDKTNIPCGSFRQDQIDRLADIANNHQVIAAEMQQQTFRMRESNEILEKQFLLQQSMFLAGQDREEQTQIRREAEAKIVEQQRKNNIKPYFKWIGNSSRPDGRVGIDLKNNGCWLLARLY